MKNLNLCFWAFLAFGILSGGEVFGQTSSQTFNTNGTFTVPAGVTNITVECWGGGGGGGNSLLLTNNGGGGGGGGGYSRKVYTGLVPGTNYSVVVGAFGAGAPASSITNAGDGGDSYFNTNTAADVLARGGSRGINAGNGGAGATAGFGDVTFTGATGTNSAANGGGGGGSSAGTAANGVAGVGATAGGIAPTGGGNGGAGSTGGNGTAGTTPGGGGGGGNDAAANSGGNGGSGRVTVTYTLPNATGLSFTATSICSGNGTDVTLSSSNLVTDTYTITYNVSGTLNSISSTDVNVSFTAGAPGTATFTTAALANAENSTVNITRITNSSGNYVDLAGTANFTVYGCRSWYSYQTGNFNDFNTWTLDPSGSTFDNGSSLIPTLNDEITILNGFTVTYNVNNVSLLATEIEGGGILNMAATTGHTLGTVTGTGLLRIQGVALPTGTYTDFVSTLGGTIEYYDTGGNLPTTQTTYNNLLMTNSTGSITYVLVSNMTVNGTFSLTTTGGSTVTWQINDASNNQRTIILNGDLNVASGGRIAVGGSNANNTSGNEASTTPHSLTMYGNIVNNGIIRFFFEDTELLLTDYGRSYTNNPSGYPSGIGADIHRNELQGNAVNVTFSGTINKTVTCNNTTDFYRFIVDKGTGQQANLTVYSSNTANFRLFGPANLNANTTPANSYDYYSDNALSLRNGTLELSGSINIPLITIQNTAPLTSETAKYFALPRNAALWLNDPGVTLTLSDLDPIPVNPALVSGAISDGKDGRILIGGLLRVTAGTLNGGFSKGLGSQDGGAYLQDGGTVNVWQFRSRATGTGVFSFTQTGGTLNVGYGFALSGGVIDQYEEDYFRFDLRNANSTFQMSGSAILNIAKPTFGSGGVGDGGLFRVGSSSAN
jgi:fibronectin-binding autotransporter adhesin